MSKIKTIRQYSWDPSITVTVRLEEVDHWNDEERAFEVYDLKGTLLGQIESGLHQSSRPLYGNVAHFYKRRRKWFAKAAGARSGYMYYFDYESQAEAIRALIRDHKNKEERR